ncbi:MAG: YHS domain protein [Chitinophagaceae bacterium]|nr:MAG: YHS domain protein [Chitinophagaceae bacterium]
MIIGCLTCFICLFASKVSAQKSEIFAPEGIAIKGFDVVSFYSGSEPSKGFDSLSFSWKNANWLFSSKENLESFKKDPDHFAPQYGGYCAYGTADGHKAPTETGTWTIVEGKLYFNYNNKVKEFWMKDQPALIKKADKNWPAIKNKE